MTRRTVLLGLSARPADIGPALRALEAKAGGRLGVCAVDTGTGRRMGQRMDERFAMCSTFKLPLAAVILREAEQGRLKLDEILPYTKADLLTVSPVTGPRVSEGGMTVVALAEGTQKTSDNTAANLLLKRLGGPAGFTRILRSVGDKVTRVDRTEPAMNLVHPGEVRDTTTPRAMAATMARFLTSPLLGRASQERLGDWMVATQTGTKRIRAGLPAGWRAGDKTGTAWDMAEGVTDKYNDVAVIWPPGRKPLLVAAYFDTNRTSREMSDEDQAVLAEVGRIVARWVAG